MSKVMRRALAGVASVVLLILGVQFIGTTSASAHANVVTGQTTCEANGTYTVVWRVANDYASAETADVSSSAPNGGAVTLSKTHLSMPSNGSDSLTQSGIPGNSASASLSVSGHWADGWPTPPNTQIDSGSVNLGGNCLPGKTPATPTYTNGGCDSNFQVTKPTITLPADAGIVWTVNGTAHSPGTFQVTGGKYTVDATSTTYKLSGQTEWVWQITEQQGDCLTKTNPVAPTVTESVCKGNAATTPTLTLPTTAGIEYSAPAGPYAAGDTVIVTATLKPGYEWGTSLGSWTVKGNTATLKVKFDAAPDCRTTATPTDPTVTQSICPVTGTTPTAPSVTLPANTASVSYTVNPASGWTAGTSATVTATAQGGYKFANPASNGWTWVNDITETYTVNFDAAPTCLVPVNPTVTESACTTGTTPTAPTLTFDTTPGIVYTVSTPGPYTGGQTVTVTATAQSGYAFDSGPVGQWKRVSDTVETLDVTFQASPNCIVPATPSFTSDQCKDFAPTTATYTIPDTTGVDYYVDNVLTVAGTYTATDSSTVTVTAKAQTGYTLVGTTTWTNTFGPTPTCVQNQRAAKATFTATQCLTGQLTPGTYTIPSTTGVDYLVSTETSGSSAAVITHSNGSVVGAGTYKGTPGTTVTVLAVAKPGFTLVGASSWTYTFEKLQCSNVDSTSISRSPTSPNSASNASTSRPPLAVTGVHSSSLLTTGLALLVGGIAITVLGSVALRRRSNGHKH